MPKTVKGQSKQAEKLLPSATVDSHACHDVTLVILWGIMRLPAADLPLPHRNEASKPWS
jgi:hypothetical protein